MTYTMTLTFTVHGLTSLNDARDMQANMAEHVLDTFNDDDATIEPFVKLGKVEKIQ